MIVICKKNTKKLVKGLRYEIHGLYNSGKNQRWMEGKLEIKGFGRFVVSNFTDVSGNPIPNIDIIPKKEVFKTLNFDTLKKGDILVCNSDSYKLLVKNGMYKIESIDSKSETLTGYGGANHTIIDRKIKFEGINRKIKFSSWKFRALTSQETREISLRSLLDGKEAEIIKTSKFRKIDIVLNKHLELMKILSKSILDENRHHLSVIDWGCQKLGTNLSIQNTDFNDLLKMKLEDILEKIQTK